MENEQALEVPDGVIVTANYDLLMEVVDDLEVMDMAYLSVFGGGVGFRRLNRPGRVYEAVATMIRRGQCKKGEFSWKKGEVMCTDGAPNRSVRRFLTQFTPAAGSTFALVWQTDLETHPHVISHGFTDLDVRWHLYCTLLDMMAGECQLEGLPRLRLLMEPPR